jgi:hypothetical protein
MVGAWIQDDRIAPGTDTTEDFWHLFLSCPGCSAVVELSQWFTEWFTSVPHSAKAVDDLCTELACAMSVHELRALVLDRLDTFRNCIPLGVPALEDTVKRALGTGRLTCDVRRRAPSLPPPAGFREPPHYLVPCDEPSKLAFAEGTAVEVVGVWNGDLLCLPQGASDPLVARLAIVDLDDL